jgi:hypothetical protein
MEKEKARLFGPFLHFLAILSAASVWAELGAAADVPVEVLGGLVISRVGVNAGSAAAVHEVPGDRLRGTHQHQERKVSGARNSSLTNLPHAEAQRP